MLADSFLSHHFDDTPFLSLEHYPRVASEKALASSDHDPSVAGSNVAFVL